MVAYGKCKGGLTPASLATRPSRITYYEFPSGVQMFSRLQLVRRTEKSRRRVRCYADVYEAIFMGSR